MKINYINNKNISFKHIILDGTICWEILEKSGEKEISDIKSMSMKGFEYGYVYYDRDNNTYILKGINPINKEKQYCCYLGRYITAQRIKNAIRSYNNLSY